MTDDWRYSALRMEVRAQVLSILLAKYGGDLNEHGIPANPPESIYACAHDWVSQGNVRVDGIVKYYEAYYKNG